MVYIISNLLLLIVIIYYSCNFLLLLEVYKAQVTNIILSVK